MCELMVGRVGVGLRGVRTSQAQLDGDEVKINGHLLGAPSDMMAIAEQYRGYVDSADEPFVPIWWDRCDRCQDLARLDGFYTLTSVSVSMTKVNRLDVSLSMRRVRGWGAPLFELRLLGAERAGSEGPAAFWHALPECRGYEQGSITPSMTSRACEPSRPGESGEVTVFAHEQLRDSHIDFYVPPGSWYVGAASVTVDGELVVGRQARQSTNWVLSNGIVRVRGIDGSGSIGMDRWDGQQWVDVGEWTAGRPDGIGTDMRLWPLAEPHALTVLHNSPHLAAIRLTSDAQAMYNARFGVTFDLALRRGGAGVEVSLSTRGAYRWSYSMPAPFGSLQMTGHTLSSNTLRLIGTRTGTAGVHEFDGRATVVELSNVQRQQWMWGILPDRVTPQVAYAQWRAAMTEHVAVVAR